MQIHSLRPSTTGIVYAPWAWGTISRMFPTRAIIPGDEDQTHISPVRTFALTFDHNYGI